MVSALEVLAAALQAGEGVGGVLEGIAEHLAFRKGLAGAAALVGQGKARELEFPEMALGFAEAAEGPLGIDEDVNEGALGGGLGLGGRGGTGWRGRRGPRGLRADDLGL